MTADKTNENKNLNALVLEDSLKDFELIKEQLIDAGYTLNIEWVETEDAFASSLRSTPFDIILADFKLSGFDAFCALRIRNEICPDTPFICVSGAIGEEIAIELLKSGALDYVIKDRPDRLPFAVERALNETLEKRIRKQNEAELRKVTTAVEQAGEIILITDPDGIIQYVNPAFTAVTGYSREEAVGQNPRLLKSGKQDQGVYQELWRTIADGRFWKGRLVNKRKDGTLYTEEATISSVKDASGQILNYVGVKRDISEFLRTEEERAKLQAQFQQAQKIESIGQLAGGVAHDFNNMLGVILGHAEMALMKADPSSPFISDLQEISNAAQRSATLTRQLLTFARKQVITPKVLALNEAVAGTLNMLQRLIGENIQLSWNPAAKLWPVMVDPSQVDQILANLCVNARDAIAGIGKISIKTANSALSENAANALPYEAVPGDYVLLSVSDNGCGMDKQVQAHIFEPFYTTKEVGSGTGLGLSTVYGAVKQNHGFLTVYSEVGLGTVFNIYLPRASKVVEAIQVTVEKPLLRGTETILLVEDDEMLLILVAAMLEESGYTVLSAATAQLAQSFASEHPGPIQLLISDMIMPVMNGRTLAARLLPLRPEIKTLFLSGYTADIISDQGVLKEDINFLQKPFSFEALTAKVREVLDAC